MWLLARPSVGKDVARSADRALKGASQSLAVCRDAHVVAKTLRRIERFTESPQEKESIRRVARAVRKSVKRATAGVLLDERWKSVVASLQAEFARWESLDDSIDTGIVAAVRRTYRKGQSMAAQAFTNREPEGFHDWRKWVKYLSLQLSTLASMGYRVDSKRLKQTAVLAEHLGEYNDLDNVRILVRSRLEAEVDYQAVRDFYRVVSRIEQESIRRFRKECRGVYPEKPKEFVANVIREPKRA